MLKRLAILGLLVLVNGAWSQVPGDRSAQNHKAQSGEKGTNPNQPLPTRVNAEVPASEEKKSANPQSPEYPWHELYGPANIPNWFLVLIGGCGVFAAVKTLGILNRQSRLMREQLDRMVERERARMGISVQPIKIDDNVAGRGLRLITCLELTNAGHSNAYIRFGAASFCVVRADGRLPEVDPDGLPFGSEIIEPSKPPIYAGFWGEDISFTTQEFAQGLADSTLRVRVFGFIEYETMGIAFHRDFGYIWTLWEPLDDPSSVVSPNPKNTDELWVFGQWEQDMSQKNHERKMDANPN
jgi:hypothetical protein